MKRVLPGIFSLLVVTVTIAGLMNVYADAAPIMAMAKAAACANQGPKCRANPTRVMKTPIWHDIKMHTPKKIVDVRCARAMYLIGEFACAIQ